MTDRLPRGDIPEDLRCRHPDCVGKDAYKQERGFRLHAWNAHRIKYEKNDTRSDLAKLKNIPDPLDKKDIDDLDTWQVLGLAMKEVYGMAQKDIVASVRGGKGLQTLSAVSRSEAGQKLTKIIREKARDPENLVRYLLAFSSPHILVHWMAAFEGASEAGAYETVHKMAKEIGLANIINDKSEQAGPPVVIQIGGDISGQEVRVSHEVLPAIDDETY